MFMAMFMAERQPIAFSQGWATLRLLLHEGRILPVPTSPAASIHNDKETHK